MPLRVKATPPSWLIDSGSWKRKKPPSKVRQNLPWPTILYLRIIHCQGQCHKNLSKADLLIVKLFWPSKGKNYAIYIFIIIKMWRVCLQKPISPFLSIFKYGHHRIIQKKIFNMIPRSLHIKDYFWSYVQKYQKFSYYCLYISAASIANISIWQKLTYRFLRTNSSCSPCI